MPLRRATTMAPLMHLIPCIPSIPLRWSVYDASVDTTEHRRERGDFCLSGGENLRCCGNFGSGSTFASSPAWEVTIVGSAKHFRMEISFNEKTGDPVAAYLQVRAGEVAETKEVEEGVAFADYDSEGVLLGVELLAPCPF